MDFPHLLADAMERLKMDTAGDLAAYIGVSQGAVSKWMSRQRTPRKKSWARLAGLLQVTVAEIATSIGETQMDSTPSNAVQLRQCQKALDRVVEENVRLRVQIRDAKR